MSNPYSDSIKNNNKIRTFYSDVNSSELVWHRDRQHRVVTVLEGSGWYFQMDESIPFEMEVGDVIFIEKEQYHRLFKVGKDDLVISIKESPLKSFNEATKPNMDFGTSSLAKKYRKDTPGQSESQFKPHWMYDPKTGKKEKAKEPEDHERLSAKGWIHEPISEEAWEDGYERRVVKTTSPDHIENGFKWRIKGKKRDNITIKLYKKKPDFAEFKRQMKRVAGHEFGQS